MPRIEGQPPNGAPTWVDLGVPDLDRAKDFYTAVFGWALQDQGPDLGSYHIIRKGDEIIGGMMRNPDADASAFWWQLYLATDDCDAAAKRVADAGGSVIMPADDVPGQGRMAIVADAQGAQFGLWQAGGNPGFQIIGEPGAVAWAELVTAGARPAAEFYKQVFGHTLEEVPGDMEYVVLNGPDGDPLAGVMSVPGAASTGWDVYFAVEDTDATVAKVRELGGTVEEAPTDSPYGRWATLADPFGARFRVIVPQMPE